MKYIITCSNNDDEIMRIVKQYLNLDEYHLSIDTAIAIREIIFTGLLVLSCCKQESFNVTRMANDAYAETIAINPEIDLFCYHTLFNELIETKSFLEIKATVWDLLNRFNGRPSIVNYEVDTYNRTFILELDHEKDNTVL